jgi:hypothetical protein
LETAVRRGAAHQAEGPGQSSLVYSGHAAKIRDAAELIKIFACNLLKAIDEFAVALVPLRFHLIQRSKASAPPELFLAEMPRSPLIYLKALRYHLTSRMMQPSPFDEPAPEHDIDSQMALADSRRNRPSGRRQDQCGWSIAEPVAQMQHAANNRYVSGIAIEINRSAAKNLP